MTIPKNTLMTMAIIMMAGLNGMAELTINSNSPTITENFNSMGEGNANNNTLPQGWKIDRNLQAARQVGAWTSACDTVMYYLSENLASNQSNGTYGFFASDDSEDRAIGGLTTSVANGTRGVNLMTCLVNNDEQQILTNLNLDYNVEKYRYGSNKAGFSVRIFSSSDGHRWTEAEDLRTDFEPDDQTIGAPTVPIATKALTDMPLRVHVEPGDSLYLAWNISVTTGTDFASAPGLAIDDIKIKGTFAPTDDDWVEEEMPDFNPSGIYLRGEVNGWAASQEWEFSKLSDSEYVIYNKTLSGSFKVADANWSATCNYGSNGSNLTMNTDYVLEGGSDPGNISCGGLSFPCAQILLTIENEEAVLKLVPNTSITGLTSVYMVGDFNSWDYMNTSGKLTLDDNDGYFKGNVALTAGSDGLSHWMIYQRVALAGAWGLEKDATMATSKGTLIACATGHVASEPGMYDVVFDIKTGDYTLTLKSSTPTSLVLSPAAATIVPQLPSQVKVLSLNNSLIHYNDQAKVFNDIAASQGKDANWVKHTNLGKTLQYHWDEGDGMTEAGEPGAKMVIRSDAWSHIILQEQTTLPCTDFDSFNKSVKQWVEYIRENCPNPNAVIILPLNWALGQDWTNFSDYNKKLVENYTKVAQEYGVVICPVGIAYQNKFEKDGGSATEKDWFLPGDDRHPTLKATYLAALMEYGIIFNEDPENVTYYPDYTTENDLVGEMSANIAAEMRNYASTALKSYDNIINHHTGTLNLKAAVLDQFGIEMAGQPMTWSVTPAGATLSDGVFTSTQTGVYTIKVTSGNMNGESTITVGEPVTEMPELDFIELSEDNLNYKQDFDSMGRADEAQIPEGWRADGQLEPRKLGSYQLASSVTLKASQGENFGSTAKNGVWNFGDSSDLDDRALGGATTDVAGGAKSINIYAAFKNTGKKSITSLDLSYDIEKYRGGNNSAGFTVQLYTSFDGKNWTSAGEDFRTAFSPDAATAGADVTPMETRGVNGVIDINMVPGTELFLAWNISASTGTSCMSAPLLAIDNVEMQAVLKPVPVYNYYIYIENQSGYENTALYAWGDKELFGSWPGQHHFDEVTINGVNYEVYGYNDNSGNFSLIYNNNNNGQQHNDFEITGGSDYYFRANSDKTLTLISTNSIEEITGDADSQIYIKGDTVICEGATEINLFNTGGVLMAKSSGKELNATSVSPGLYIVVAKTSKGVVSRKMIKR